LQGVQEAFVSRLSFNNTSGTLLLAYSAYLALGYPTALEKARWSRITKAIFLRIAETETASEFSPPKHGQAVLNLKP
jgi:hypothetical protein